MFEFHEAVRISRPPEDVFALLTRFEDIPKFVPQVVSAEQTSAGEVSAGTTFVQRGRFLGRTVETPTVVTTHEPPSRFGYRADQGPVPYEALYDFIPSDGGTLLQAAVTVRLRGAARGLEPLVGRLVRRAYARNLERMRDLLER
jgi:ligand-binding SRPBCC domain-containing protein